jgi:transposase InsO family protein
MSDHDALEQVIKIAWRTQFTASQGIYGALRVFLDLREAGETCSRHRVVRLMREYNLRALHGYRTRHWSVGKPAVLIPNRLQRPFTVTRRHSYLGGLSPEAFEATHKPRSLGVH